MTPGSASCGATAGDRARCTNVTGTLGWRAHRCGGCGGRRGSGAAGSGLARASTKPVELISERRPGRTGSSAATDVLSQAPGLGGQRLVAVVVQVGEPRVEEPGAVVRGVHGDRVEEDLQL